MIRIAKIVLVALAIMAWVQRAEDDMPSQNIHLPVVLAGYLIHPPEIQRGVTFLLNQYNPEVGLLRESVAEAGITPVHSLCDGSDSPTSRLSYMHKHYLTNDNALAAYTLETLGAELDLADTLRASLKRYGYDRNDFIEVAWGETITWPPYHHADQIVAQLGPDYVIQETHSGSSDPPDPYLCYFYDWSAYANLAFMGALNEYNRGYRESALRLHAIEMAKFDGRGWRDKAYWDRKGVYETIGPAWGLYAGAIIGAPMDGLEKLRNVLLSVQDPASGGFHTHYDSEGPRAYPNVETTSLALLALDAHRRRAAVEQAIDYLNREFNPIVGLLRESPVVRPHCYWLATDNRLAVYALQTAGEKELSEKLLATLREYGNPRHGLIEVLRGEIISWPPYTPTQTCREPMGEEEICLETRTEGNQFTDWYKYADLNLFGALLAFWEGDEQAAHKCYQEAMRMWDGRGFGDKVYTARCEEHECLYETYKLGLALYVAQVIGVPRNADVFEALLAKQAPPGATCDGQSCGGGFYTLYDNMGQPQGDTSTETTAYAILGLAFPQLGLRHFLPSVSADRSVPRASVIPQCWHYHLPFIGS